MPDLTQIEISHQATRRYAEYWLSLPRDGLVPPRMSFDPAHVPQLLPGCSIHEIVSPEIIRVRLAGTRVVKRFGFEVTGSNHLDHIHPSRRDRASLALRNIASHPCGMWVRIRAVRRSGLIYDTEVLGLPFLDTKGVPTQVIYQSNVVTPDESGRTSVDPRVNSMPIRRQYVDIGGGIPDWDYSGDTEEINPDESGWSPA